MREDIKEFCKERQIPYLLHFTRSENLQSILANGLQPRSVIDTGHVAATVNDASRFDERRDCSCLSISFPNYKMFWPLRKDSPGVEWPLLVIHPKVLWAMDCMFCRTNAASNSISTVADGQLQTLEAFRSMFAESDLPPKRADEFLKVCDPTDVQAEVLVRGVIPPAAIYAVVFQSVPDMNFHKAACGERQTLTNDARGLYGKRQYYRQHGHGR